MFGVLGSHDAVWAGRHTFLDAVLLSATLALLLLNALDALIEVVLGGGTLGRVLALC
jgi:hypothetical protein